jgi:hypothetical protein
MRQAAITLAAVLAFSAAGHSQSAARTSQETAEMVLGSETAIDYLAAASDLFTALPAEQGPDQIWRALYHIRTMFDGAAAEEYAHMAFLLSADHPLVFYRRFMSGDSYSLILQEDVFLEDTLVLHGTPSEDAARSASVRAVLDKVVTSLKAAAPESRYSDSARLHEAFASRVLALRERWETQRADLLRLRSK